MNPSERLRILGARSFQTAAATPHLAPSVARVPSPEAPSEDPARPFAPGRGMDPSDRPSPGRPEISAAEPLPNPFLASGPEPQTRTPAPACDLAAHDIPVDAATRGLPADVVDFDTPAEADTRPDADDTVAAGDRALIRGVAQPPQAADELDRVPRPSDEFDAFSPPCPTTDVGTRVDRPAGTVWSRAAKLHLTPETTAAESFRIIVFESLLHLAANHDCARLNLHVEGVHQCRIALRRLRSAFTTYGPVLRRERIQPIEQTVGWIGKTLGAARDLDVLRTELVSPAAEALGESRELAALMNKLESQQAIAREAVRDALTSARYGRLLTDLRELGTDQPDASVCASPDQPVTAIALPALTLAHRKLLKRGKDFETLSEDERHEVRIALKRLRYALDFFGALFNGGSKRKYIKRVAHLQDDLGHLNDVAAANRMLAQLVGLTGAGSEPATRDPALGSLAFAAGGILGWHRREAARSDRRLVKDWYAFVQSTPFWSR